MTLSRPAPTGDQRQERPVAGTLIARSWLSRRHPNEQCRPTTRCRLHLERSVYQSDAFANTKQPEPFGASRITTEVGGVEATAVVVDDHCDEPAVRSQNDADAGCTGMADHVGQRLLKDPV